MARKKKITVFRVFDIYSQPQRPREERKTESWDSLLLLTRVNEGKLSHTTYVPRICSVPKAREDQRKSYRNIIII